MKEAMRVIANVAVVRMYVCGLFSVFVETQTSGRKQFVVR